jgi:hypothetical protein
VLVADDGPRHSVHVYAPSAGVTARTYIPIARTCKPYMHGFVVHRPPALNTRASELGNGRRRSLLSLQRHNNCCRLSTCTPCCCSSRARLHVDSHLRPQHKRHGSCMAPQAAGSAAQLPPTVQHSVAGGLGPFRYVRCVASLWLAEVVAGGAAASRHTSS